MKRGEEEVIEVSIRPRKGSRGICSVCGQRGPTYDTQEARAYDFVPLWGIRVFLVYALRRIDCKRCGKVKVERVPWAEGKRWTTTAYEWFLARWAKRLSWQETARVFGTSWDTVYRSVQRAVAWGLEKRSLEGITAIGVDEIAYKKGHHYLTLVYQINEGCSRLLWIGQKREEETLRGFFEWLGEKRTAALKFIASDMWEPYRTVIAEKAEHALHVLDRFHIMRNFNKALDQIRAAEAKKLEEEGYEPVLKKTRWIILKRPGRLKENQAERLADLLRYNLRTVKAYLLREEFQKFWEYISPTWAGKFLDDWCRETMRSRIEPMKKIVRSLREHRELILNWFRAESAISCGIVEGLNNKVKLNTRKSYGFRKYDTLEVALYHALGNLPEPEDTHKFC